MSYPVIFCFVFAIAISFAKIDNPATLAEIHNSTECSETQSLMQKYLELANEMTVSSANSTKTLVKREPALDGINPNDWPGIGFENRPAYEESAPILVSQIVDQVPIVEQVKVTTYRYLGILAAQIGPYIFSCRQDNTDLVIRQQLTATTFQVAFYPGEISYHPLPGIWWFVQCIPFETTGNALNIQGVQRAGGDAGVNPKLLASGVGK